MPLTISASVSPFVFSTTLASVGRDLRGETVASRASTRCTCADSTLAHLADRALQFSFERAAVVDALREVRHSPRRLVEQLESGATGHWDAALRERDARFRQIADRDHDVRAAALEFVFHAGLIELVGHLRHALERNADERRHPGRSAGPLRHGEDQPGGSNANDEYEYSSSATEEIGERREEIGHLI